MEHRKPALSVIGLGKLGSPMVAVFAHKGYKVTGLDINESFVSALSQGKAPVQEPRLQELIDQHRDLIRATTDYDVLIGESDVTFIIVPTPSGPDHLFTNKYVIEAVSRIGKALRKKSGYHAVVVTSTVIPGSTDGEIRSALEASSGRKVGPNLGLCYNPEFIALGSVIRDMLYPDMILIGESDDKVGAIIEAIYRNSTNSGPVICRMSPVNAEITKISVNTFVTTKISYANMIADLCDRLPGADAEVVNMAVGADSRIGRKYLKGATGYGGPCFPRDNLAFAALCAKVGARQDLAVATDRINDHQIARLQSVVEACTASGDVVAILGLSYKPDTAVIEASQAVTLAKLLADASFEVVVFDPMALDGAYAILRSSVGYASSAFEAIGMASTVLIMTPWAEFKALPATAFSQGGRLRTVIDPWRVVNEATAGIARYVVPGKPQAENSAFPAAAKLAAHN
jgi:UDPglucose 6-dehydrogenase